MNAFARSDDNDVVALNGPVSFLLRDLIQEKTGVFFEDGRFRLLAEKIAPRMAFQNCESFLDYYYLLKYEERGAEEWRALMDAFSVQETYFWREFDQIRFLTQQFVPDWFRQKDLPLRIWSAACATGEEPYSVAIALVEAGWGDRPIEILASDASEGALAKARRAIYRERSFRSLPSILREKYFGPDGEGLALDPRIKERVTFQWANLVNLPEVSEFGLFPIVFCRNVFIYFTPSTITRVVASFADRMPEGGKLFTGASESLLKLTDRFELKEISGAFLYEQKAKP